MPHVYTHRYRSSRKGGRRQWYDAIVGGSTARLSNLRVLGLGFLQDGTGGRASALDNACAGVHIDGNHVRTRLPGKGSGQLLLENYGGFLPRQGHAYAEQMKEAAAEMERLRQDLLGSPSSDGNGRAAF